MDFNTTTKGVLFTVTIATTIGLITSISGLNSDDEIFTLVLVTIGTVLSAYLSFRIGRWSEREAQK